MVSIILQHQKVKLQTFNHILGPHTTIENTKNDHFHDGNHSLGCFGIFWCKITIRRDCLSQTHTHTLFSQRISHHSRDLPIQQQTQSIRSSLARNIRLQSLLCELKQTHGRAHQMFCTDKNRKFPNLCNHLITQ